MIHICKEVDEYFNIENEYITSYLVSKRWLSIRSRYIKTRPCYLPFSYKGFLIKIIEGL